MFNKIHDGVEWRGSHQVVRAQAWGADSIRVRAGLSTLHDVPGAPHEKPDATPEVSVEEDRALVVNGTLTLEISGDGMLRFTRTDTGEELLQEERAHFWWPGPRAYTSTGNGYYRIEQRFSAQPDERLYGLGQHTHGLLDQKGAVIDLVQRNAEVTIPFMVSSRGYGFLWNSPAVGRVELAETGTRWVSDSARQIDYWVTAADKPAAILARYADATGHAPMLPEFASGFWQCKLRYRTQEELLEVARVHKRRGLPLSVIVSDFFHWTHLGDWKFDPTEWPDPRAMVEELRELGVELMVSVWPSVSPLSENYQKMLQSGHLIATEQGPPVHADWADKGVDAHVQVSFYDATNPEAREFFWDRLRENYLSLGIRVWWLDACEPELKPGHPENLRYHLGPGTRSATSTPPCTRAVSTRACSTPESPKSSPCAGPPGPVASATAPRCGRGTSTPPSPHCAPRSGPDSTWRCPVCPGGPPTSVGSTVVTPTRPPIENCSCVGSSTGSSARCCACTASGSLPPNWTRP